MENLRTIETMASATAVRNTMRHNGKLPTSWSYLYYIYFIIYILSTVKQLPLMLLSLCATKTNWKTCFPKKTVKESYYKEYGEQGTAM